MCHKNLIFAQENEQLLGLGWLLLVPWLCDWRRFSLLDREMESIHHSEATEICNRSIFAKSKHPVTLKFEDLAYKIKTKTQTKHKKQDGSSERNILKGISGVVNPGEMLAMMGPSGSGKTTLLTALGGRLANLKGSITYNDYPFTNSMKRNIGFVTQDDVLYPHLTVFDTLVYTAFLRLPNSLTKQEKVAQAEAVMTELGLTVCRNSIIGGPLLRGVSGGERKRVSIGLEMLINPSLLFLDEPTSGLDSTTAQRILETLSELTKGERTVLMTIHQPSSSIFYMFHKVLLLTDGNVVYFGKGSEVMGYFSGIGYKPSVAMNPADFLLDLANGVPSDGSLENRATVKEALVTAYNIHLLDRLKQELQGTENASGECRQPPEKTKEWTTTWWEQFSVLLKRGLKERRHDSFSWLKIIQLTVLAVIVSAFWWQSRGRLQDQLGFLYFLVGFWGVFPVYQAIYTFPEERMMLTKERSSRMYRLSSFFMARTVGDLPMELILPAIFIAITYWTVGLKPKPANFFATLCVMLLNVLVAQGLGLVLGAFVFDIKSATTLGAVIMLISMVISGFYVQNLPPFINWIKYISFIFHSFKLLVACQLSAEDTYECESNTKVFCIVGDFPMIKYIGLGHEYVAIVVLIAVLFLCRLASYLALMRVGITK